MSKTVIVTGSSRGIGKATAMHFAKNGWNVVVNSNKSEDEGKRTANEIAKLTGARTVYVKADVSDSIQADYLIKQTEKIFGKIDCLVNNASLSDKKLFIDTTDADFENSIVGLKGAINCSKAAIKKMKDEGGSIVNISSIWGVAGASGEVLYSTAKAAVIGFTKALSKEMGSMGVRVNSVAPGFIETEMTKNETMKTKKYFKEKASLGRLGNPDDIAKVVYFLGGDESGFVTGQTIVADGGLLD